MRPDEHKKKQRADYKKKHGISNKKTTSKEKQESSKDINPTDTREEKDLADTDEGEHRQFSRRNVSSNWDRYEEFEDSSEEEGSATNIAKRGEDFNVLLQKSANPATQFRFQSEKDLDREIEGDSSTTQVTSSALDIDFGTLAGSLNCVPLHKRLGISADGIHPDVVKEFELNASLHSKNQQILPWSSSNETVTKPATAAMMTTSTKESRITLQHSLPPHSRKNNEQDLIKRTPEQSGNDSKQSIQSLICDKTDLSHVKQPGGTSEPCTLQKKENLQNSLKDVLKAVNTSSKADLPGGEQLVHQSQKVNNEEDDELEFLLSLETPGGKDERKSSTRPEVNEVTSASKKVPPSTVNPTVQSAKKAEDDLEDWLDSVLS